MKIYIVDKTVNLDYLDLLLSTKNVQVFLVSNDTNDNDIDPKLFNMLIHRPNTLKSLEKKFFTNYIVFLYVARKQVAQN